MPPFDNLPNKAIYTRDEVIELLRELQELRKLSARVEELEKMKKGYDELLKKVAEMEEK